MLANRRCQAVDDLVIDAIVSDRRARTLDGWEHFRYEFRNPLEQGLRIEVASHREPLPVTARDLPQVILAIDSHGELGVAMVKSMRVREHADQVVQWGEAD
jgi:hypothetical protein